MSDALPRPVTATDLDAGTAAEYIVCADLLLAGYRAFRSDQACAYDVAVDIGRLVRVQVKSTRGPRSFPQAKQRHVVGYCFTCRRGKGAMRAYDLASFDVFAFVALDTRIVGYVSSDRVRQTMQFPLTGMKRADARPLWSFPFVDAIARLR